jgi:hypothetical protein
MYVSSSPTQGEADRQYAPNMNIGNNVPSSTQFQPRDISQNPISTTKRKMKMKKKIHHKGKRSNVRLGRKKLDWKLVLQLF